MTDRVKRRSWRVLVGILLVITTAIGAVGWFASTTLPQTEGTLTADGLKGTVRIVRDKNAVPHIFADHDTDASFALGFTHAQDRLWQMESFRRIGSGTMSEIVGSATVRIDTFMRAMGFAERSASDFAALGPEVQIAIKAYTDGINHYIDTLQTVPLEFTVLRAEPSLWKPEDVILVSKLMSVRLAGNMQQERLNAALSGTLGPGRLETLFEDWPVEDEAVFREVWQDKNARLWNPLLDTTPFLAPVTSASNAWASAPGRTETGGALLASDPHLGLDAPILWYLARTVVGTREITGATIPGLPFHVMGQNGHIAWAMTSTGADTQDLFIERIDPAAPSQYLVPRGARPFEVKQLELSVHGEDKRKIEYRVTRHGPVLSDLNADLKSLLPAGHVVALSYATTKLPDTGMGAAYKLARARSWAQAREAMKLMTSPVFNFFVADSAGTVATRVAGAIPVRREGAGVLPLPGWTGQYDWQGWIDFEDLPESVQTETGYVANANNRLEENETAPPITQYWQDDLRYRRLKKLLDGAAEHSLEIFHTIQQDINATDADLLLPVLLEQNGLAGEREAAALALLRDWDRKMSAYQAAPLIFTAWLRELNRALFQDEMNRVYPKFARYRVPLLERLLRQNSRWCDDVTTRSVVENCKTAVETSFVRALDWIEQKQGRDMALWQWGKHHKATLEHSVFSQVPVLSWWSDRSLATDGGFYTLNRGAGPLNDSDSAFAHNHGSGYRALYDLKTPGNSRFIIATGQSGNIFSPHWGDFVRRWRSGEMIAIGGTRDDLVSRGAQELVLGPPQ